MRQSPISQYTMASSLKKYFEVGNEFSDIFSEYSIVNAPKTSPTSGIDVTIKDLDKLKELDEQLQAEILNCLDNDLQMNKLEMNALKCALGDLTQKLQQDLEFLTDSKDCVRKAILSGKNERKEALRCENPEMVKNFLRTLYKVLLIVVTPARLPTTQELDKRLQTLEMENLIAADIIQDITSRCNSLKTKCPDS